MLAVPRSCRVLGLACGLLAAGCSTPGSSITQLVRVETPGRWGVSCDLSNDQGHWTVPRTPGAVAVTSSHRPLRVSCLAEGGARGESSTSSDAAPTTGQGAAVGGLVGGGAVGAAFGATALAFIAPLGVIAVVTGAAAGAAAGQVVESKRQAVRYPELIVITMGDTPESMAGPPQGPRLGIGVRGLPPVEARTLGIEQHGAVLVTRVNEGSAAAVAGLRSGDIVLAANGHDVFDATQLELHVRALAFEESLLLRVWRAGQVVEFVLAARAP